MIGRCDQKIIFMDDISNKIKLKEKFVEQFIRN